MLLNGRGGQRLTATSSSSSNSAEKSGDAKRARRTWGDEHNAAAASDDEEEQTRSFFDDKREHLFIRKQHNCFLHCDFPSECHHALFRAQQERRPILREALALDAAAAAREQAVAVADDEAESHQSIQSGNMTKRITQRQNGRRSSSATRFPYSEDLLLPLPCVDEADEEDNVSPCSPTSPDPPGDLMREVQVSPIDPEGSSSSGGGGDESLPPVSPGGTKQHRRRSLLVTTDTPVDFATTAAPLCFDEEEKESDTCGDEDGDDESGDKKNVKKNSRRTIFDSRRKIAQLTGEEFGPFVFDTLSPTSPSPSSGGVNVATHGATNNNNIITHDIHAAPTALDLQAAYSEQAWFSNFSLSTARTTITADPQPLSPKSPERVGKRDRMLALLRRRVEGGGPPSPALQSSFRDEDVLVHNNAPAPGANHHHHHQQQEDQQHANAAAGGEEWESWSDSSSSYSSSSGPETDADGDVTMHDC